MNSVKSSPIPLNPVNPNISSNPKRKRDEEINDSSKRKRINPIELADLPDHLRVKIFGELGLKDFSLFDSLGKSCRDLTKGSWKERLAQKRFDFNWSDLKLDLHSSKSQYILGNAICNYVRECEKELERFPTNPNLQGIYERFEERMLRFPLFGAYVWADLNLLRKLKNVRKEFILGPKTDPLKFERDFDLLHKLEEGGDSLLRGLYQYRLLNEFIQKKEEGQGLLPNEIIAFQEAHKTLSEAIQKNATCASFLAVKVSFCNYKIKFSFASHFSTLGIEAAGKNRDYRGLDATLQRYNRFFQYIEDLEFPPMLATKAMCDHSLTNEEKEHLFAEAISEYGIDVSGWVLGEAAYIKHLLDKNEEAEQMYDQAFRDPNYKPQCGDYNIAAFVKFHLKKYDEADFFFDQALKDPNYKPDPDILLYIAFVKMKLNKFVESKSFYEKALNAPDFNPSPQMLSFAEEIKLELEKKDKA